MTSAALGSEPVAPLDERARARQAMIRRIVAGGVRDARVLRAMRNVPRERFVDEALAGRAYGDDPLPIGDGQTLSSPVTHAAALEALALEGDERVLEVGTGTGYQAALLGHLAREVLTIERVERLAHVASDNLVALGCTNVVCACGDGSHGWPERAPFDAIVLAAASPGIPEGIARQLTPGGRMLLPLAEAGAQQLVRVRRHAGIWKIERLSECRFVPLVGAHGFDDPRPR